LNLAGLASAAVGTSYAALDAGQPPPGEQSAASGTSATGPNGPTRASRDPATGGAGASTREGAAAPGGAGERAGASGSGGNPAGGSGAESSGQLVQRFGALVGRQFVSGGQLVNRELISRVRGSLLSAFDGRLGKLQGLVLVRADPTGMTVAETQASVAFESGLVAGLAAAGVPVVGVELSSTEPSQVPWYESKNLSSVDDLDTTAGQAALIYALTGSHGAFGTKPTADSLLPNIVQP
jgi:hypothetical protein